ncbi:hypothetical protein HGI30_00370 [Paenibacillus albicereus]|uniref:Pilus assembly protein PilO n=1 Tax=Paenibacillus albicereus TaxID=2726185 RepID=A0A6H2GS44_9BACL|nr:hypothetical protein [Paenibacillus albicereus]QJC50215.1 hypothetical protein HGI30_00370 [Paenibacillus albicereus]
MAARRNSLILLVSAILFLGLLMFFLYGLGPAEEKTASLEAELGTQQKLNDILIAKLQERQEEAEPRPVDGVQAELPYWDNTEQLVLDLDKIGSESGVEHVSIAFSGDLAASRPLGGPSSAPAAVPSEAAPGEGASATADAAAPAGDGLGLAADGSPPGEPPPAEKAAGPLRLQVSVVVKGTYDAVLKYAKTLHGLTRLTTLESLELNRSSCNCGSEQELTVPLAFSAYFQPSYRDRVETPLLPYAESSVPSPPPRS